VLYRASAWGKEFHASQVDELLGGGSAGPGKSLALLMDPGEQIVTEHMRWKRGDFAAGQSRGWALHLRREFPRLEQTIHRSKVMFEALDNGARYDPQTHKWTFSSGYKVQFGHLSEKDSYLNYRSNEYTWLGIDEVGEIDSKDTYDELVLRVRSTDPVLRSMLKVRLVSNPCAGWVRDYFVEPHPEGRKILTKRVRLKSGEVRTRTRMFLPARLADNPDPEFRAQYEASLLDRPHHIREALLHGNWYVVPGAFFADAWDKNRVVIKPFIIPPTWKRFRSMDWGFKQPGCVHWWAVSAEGEMICYREFKFNGPKARNKLDAVQCARAIRDIELANKEWNRLRDCSRLSGPADTQIWEERGQRGPTIAHDMIREGVTWSKATKGRRQAAQQMMKRLQQVGYAERPGIMFFDTCFYAINTIPALPTDEIDPEVPEKGGDDHAWDSVSYACAACPLPSGNEDRKRYDPDDDDEPAAVPTNRGKFGYG
jgi:hypothetical protein